MQQQKQKNSSRSVANRLAGAVIDEASAFAKKAKKLVSETNETETSELDAELQNNCLAQTVRSHEALQRLSGANIGRQLCEKCHIDDSASLLWDISEFCQQHQQQQPVELSTMERARFLPKAFNSLSPMIQCLYDKTAAGEPLGYPSDDATYEMVNLATDFLIDLCDNTLAEKLALIFSGASVSRVGGWAQEAALACTRPNLDFVLSLPAWIATNKLCLCDFAGFYGTVVRNTSNRLPFETQVHQSAIFSLERLIAGAAVSKLQEMESEGPVRLDYEKGVSYNPGADSHYVWAPKRVILNVICSTSSGEDKECTLRLTFGIPCQFVGQADSDVSSDQEPFELHGHLLFGRSAPLMVSVSLEEKKYLLSGAETSDHPRLRLLRMVKFLLHAGQQLSLLKSETSKSDQTISFFANYIVRETQRRYEMAEEAYYRANFGDRFIEVIEALSGDQTSMPFFSFDCNFAKIAKPKLPPSTLRLLEFVQRPGEEQQDADRLLKLLLQILTQKDKDKLKKVVKKIDSILKQ